jgi:predicted GTPase
MAYGAGWVAATRAGAEIVDPKPFAAPEIAAVLRAYPHIGAVLPALGYGDAQLRALEATIEKADADVVVAATPIDLARLLRTSKKIVRARYAFAEADEPTLGSFIDDFLERAAIGAR